MLEIAWNLSINHPCVSFKIFNQEIMLELERNRIGNVEPLFCVVQRQHYKIITIEFPLH